jgi:hypothetical protein
MCTVKMHFEIHFHSVERWAGTHRRKNRSHLFRFRSQKSASRLCLGKKLPESLKKLVWLKIIITLIIGKISPAFWNIENCLLASSRLHRTKKNMKVVRRKPETGTRTRRFQPSPIRVGTNVFWPLTTSRNRIPDSGSASWPKTGNRSGSLRSSGPSRPTVVHR